jgi:hypothetical protein
MRKNALSFLMLFVVALVGAFALVPAAIAGPAWTGTATITVATDNVLSPAVALPSASGMMGKTPIKKIALKIPTITSSTVKFQVSADGGTTYAALWCFSNGTNTILWNTAAGTGGEIVEVPCDFTPYTHLKVECGTAQAGNRTFTLYGVP